VLVIVVTSDVIGLGIGAFVATNIDDLFILMVCFAKRTFPTSQIILGQYVGMGMLLIVALFASLIALILPHNLISLVGLFPIAIGVKELVELRNTATDDDLDNKRVVNRISKSRWSTYLPFLVVATITFSGGEEIGIYASIFATYNSQFEIGTIFVVVMVLTIAWCGIAAYLVHHNFLTGHFRKISKWILSIVLIGIGIDILTEGFLIS
jgi:cadmium resistance protein CadD (predicted permease)